jgi:hypothetical protein
MNRSLSFLDNRQELFCLNWSPAFLTDRTNLKIENRLVTFFLVLRFDKIRKNLFTFFQKKQKQNKTKFTNRSVEKFTHQLRLNFLKPVDHFFYPSTKKLLCESIGLFFVPSNAKRFTKPIELKKIFFPFCTFQLSQNKITVLNSAFKAQEGLFYQHFLHNFLFLTENHNTF